MFNKPLLVDLPSIPLPDYTSYEITKAVNSALMDNAVLIDEGILAYLDEKIALLAKKAKEEVKSAMHRIREIE